MPFTVRVIGADGRARFVNFQPGEVRVYVDGADRGTVAYADGATVHVNQ